MQGAGPTALDGAGGLGAIWDAMERILIQGDPGNPLNTGCQLSLPSSTRPGMSSEQAACGVVRTQDELLVFLPLLTCRVGTESLDRYCIFHSHASLT